MADNIIAGNLNLKTGNIPTPGATDVNLNNGNLEWRPHATYVDGTVNYDIGSIRFEELPYLTRVKNADGTWEPWKSVPGKGAFAGVSVFEYLQRYNDRLGAAYQGPTGPKKIEEDLINSGLYSKLEKTNQDAFTERNSKQTCIALGVCPDRVPPKTDDISPVIDFTDVDILGTEVGIAIFKDKFPSGVKDNTLRYPLKIINKSTDYLKISIESYGRTGSRDLTDRLISKPNDNKFKSKGAKTSNLGNIFLPIPATIQDGNSVSYADGSLDSLTGAAVGGALNVIKTTFGTDKTTNQIQTELSKKGGQFLTDMKDAGLKGSILRSIASQAASLIPGTTAITPEQLLARLSGNIMNPNMELLFNGVTLRTFKFSFKLTPRNSVEASEIKKIIKTLKINMAPVVLENDNFLRTPNVFNLTYMKGSSEHPFLHKFKTCALTDMSVNYTGEGLYATYDDASPVSMVMDLTFKELEPIYDIDYQDDGFKEDTGVGY